MIPAVTCLGCGCACDDIEVSVAGGRITEARHACELGARWFGDGQVPARTTIDGADASLEATLEAAVALLSGAAAPLVYLAPDLSCEAQREGIAIADTLRATVDSVTSATALRGILAAQERGRAGATLGEIRNRADVIVFWGVDPASAYPRYTTRYAPDPAGVHVPGGRRDRTVIAVDVGDRRGPADADQRMAVSPADEVSALAALRTGSSEWSGVLRRGRYVAIVADGETDGDVDPGRAEAFIALAQALNDHTRCALSLLRGGGNRSGADACLTWQAGYPAGVTFARGYPRYRPHDGIRGDRALILGSLDRVPPAVTARLRDLQLALVGPRASTQRARVAIDTAVAGIHESGTALRMDDVPLPLRAVIDGPPAAAAILRQLRTRLSGGPR